MYLDEPKPFVLYFWERNKDDVDAVHGHTPKHEIHVI